MVFLCFFRGCFFFVGNGLPGREKFCLGELILGEILPGKNSVPLVFGKGKREIRHEAPQEFLANIFSQ